MGGPKGRGVWREESHTGRGGEEGVVLNNGTHKTHARVGGGKSTYLFDTWGKRVKGEIYTNESESKVQSKNCKQVQTATKKPYDPRVTGGEREGKCTE